MATVFPRCVYGHTYHEHPASAHPPYYQGPCTVILAEQLLCSCARFTPRPPVSAPEAPL
jgi:hypothetical protein